MLSRVAAPVCIPTNSARGFLLRERILSRLLTQHGAGYKVRSHDPGIMISRSVSSSPASGSVLTAQSLEPASDSVSPSL